jgi:hypothetical protein
MSRTWPPPLSRSWATPRPHARCTTWRASGERAARPAVVLALLPSCAGNHRGVCCGPHLACRDLPLVLVHTPRPHTPLHTPHSPPPPFPFLQVCDL